MQLFYDLSVFYLHSPPMRSPLTPPLRIFSTFLVPSVNEPKEYTGGMGVAQVALHKRKIGLGYIPKTLVNAAH